MASARPYVTLCTKVPGPSEDEPSEGGEDIDQNGAEPHEPHDGNQFREYRKNFRSNVDLAAHLYRDRLGLYNNAVVQLCCLV
jgi:hypothetical protein